MFHGWGEFYVLVGSAAGLFISFLFIVATLNVGREETSAARGVDIFMTPIVFHLAVILALSALILAPGVAPPVTPAVVGLCAIAGLAYAGRVVWRIGSGQSPNAPHWSDIWCYGWAPAALHAALAFAAAGLAAERPFAPHALAATLVGLMLVAIRNAWDLVTWLAPRAPAR